MFRKAAVSATPRVALCAQFSTTASRRVDSSSLYSKLTGWRRKTPKAEIVDPTQSKESERSDSGMSQDSRPRKLRILGKPMTIDESWPEVKQFAEFTPWPTNHHNKNLTREQISSTLREVQSVDFSDIQARFEATKKVSETLGSAIPDPIFTNLKSVADLEKHLQSSAVKFDERQPDAIYLNPEDFVGTNIIISDPLQERRSRKQRMNTLVREAKESQRKIADELIRAQN